MSCICFYALFVGAFKFPKIALQIVASDLKKVSGVHEDIFRYSQFYWLYHEVLIK